MICRELGIRYTIRDKTTLFGVSLDDCAARVSRLAHLDEEGEIGLAENIFAGSCISVAVD